MVQQINRASRIFYVGLLYNNIKIKVVAEPRKTPGFLVSGGDEFNPGPEKRLDLSELVCNKVLLKYKRDRESF